MDTKNKNESGQRRNIGGLGEEIFLSHAPFRITVPFLEATPLCESYSNRRFSSLPYAVNCQNYTKNSNMNDVTGVLAAVVGL